MIDRCLATPRVLAEWIKGWKKGWKPFHAFTDQSWDHVLASSHPSSAIPGTRDMHHPAIYPLIPRSFARRRRSQDRICKVGAALKRDMTNSLRYEEDNRRKEGMEGVI